MQSSVTMYGAAATVGMLGDTGYTDKLSYSAEAAVGFGVPVQLGTNKERQVKVLTTSVGQAALAVGVSVASMVVEQTSGGVAAYAQYDTVPMLKKGRIWMLTDDAVVAGSVANLKLSSGLVTDESVAGGIEAFTQFSAKFLTATSGSALALVEIK
jgi:hypothetical protein